MLELLWNFLLMPIFAWNSFLKVAIFIALVLFLGIFLEVNWNRGTQTSQVPRALLWPCIFIASGLPRFKIPLVFYLHITGAFNFNRTTSITSRKVLETYLCALGQRHHLSTCAALRNDICINLISCCLNTDNASTKNLLGSHIQIGTCYFMQSIGTSDQHVTVLSWRQ